MEYVKDILWTPGISLQDTVKALGSVGFQSVELRRAVEVVVRMRKEGAKVFLTFTSNMATSGLRGLFAQLIELGLVHAVVTTVGSVEEDIMKAHGERFLVGSFHSDDVELHEKGMNRVGNLMITNESYARFEDLLLPMLSKLYGRKARWSSVELLRELGLMLKDERSILFQAARKGVPVFCPAITDGAMGFHLYLFQQKHPDFVVDVVQDFKELITWTSHDDKKGLVALGGGVSKHHAILAALLTGGLDYALYLSTARYTSGSMSGATTQEAKSWGKIKDDADAVTINGEASVFFPLIALSALEQLHEEGLL
ncbi:deoxyhypusine synthase family protein [Candidatus Woesearchaeota archaeon]|nr:deoxyhypusine synthase family protein [Candidatus Woesearchaeota archaeon]